jgi:phage terminase large subunit GpA-like protein
VPALGVASDQDVDYRGKRFKGGVKLRAVGTWPLKGLHYAYLSREAKAEGGALICPRGYCHFGLWLDENYFKQITSEYLADEKVRGKPRKTWKQRHADNHWLDCRVENLALADAYLSTMTADDWAKRARERGVPADLVAPDLFNQLPAPAGEPTAADGAGVASPSAADPFERLAKLNRGTE